MNFSLMYITFSPFLFLTISYLDMIYFGHIFIPIALSYLLPLLISCISSQLVPLP